MKPCKIKRIVLATVMYMVRIPKRWHETLMPGSYMKKLYRTSLKKNNRISQMELLLNDKGEFITKVKDGFEEVDYIFHEPMLNKLDTRAKYYRLSLSPSIDTSEYSDKINRISDTCVGVGKAILIITGKIESANCAGLSVIKYYNRFDHYPSVNFDISTSKLQ